ncbi:putative adenosine deaminase [Streptomyces sp. Tu6071]|nr:putative adenosine deaminase [Streptomyces sp. Tu6071]
MVAAGDLVLRREPRAEEERVVGAERHRDPGLEEGAQRDVRLLRVDAERHVRRRAHLARHARVGEAAQQDRVLGRAHPVPHARGVQVVEAVPYRGGARQLAPVRRREEPALARDREGAVEIARHPAPLVVGEPEADHALIGEAHREARERAGVERVLHAVRGDEDAHPEPGVARGRGDRVEDDLQGRDQAAERGRVRGRVDLDLQPPRAVAHVLLGRLADEALDVLGRAQAGAGGVVEALEAEPAALVGGAQPRRLARGEGVGEPYPVLVGEFEQRRGTHRPGEMQVQMCLRQFGEVSGPVPDHPGAGVHVHALHS